MFSAVLGIWIWIPWFMGLIAMDPSVSRLDPDPVTAPDPDVDPSIIKQNSKKNLDSYCFVASL